MHTSIKHRKLMKLITIKINKAPVPAVYIRADTKRKENNMKNIATNFQEQCELISDLSRKLLVFELPL